MMSELENRVAIVTGSSSGIGAELARHLSLAGANVVVNSATSVTQGQRVADALPTDCFYVQADISNDYQAKGLIDQAIKRFGRLDILVNNAGWTTTVDHGDLDGLTDEIFRKTFEVNVLGTWWITKAALPHLTESPDGNVVTISSVAGVRPIGSSIAYAMAKASLNHMTRLLARSHGPVRVNAVAPGLVDTPWTAEWDDAREMVGRRAPLGRPGRPDEIAEAVMGLVANTYVTGHVLVVDGGLTQAI